MKRSGSLIVSAETGPRAEHKPRFPGALAWAGFSATMAALLVAPGLAQELMKRSPGQTTQAPVPTDDLEQEILKLAPAGAWFVAYTESVSKSVSHPLADLAVSFAEGFRSVAEALGSTFGGPGMIAIHGEPTNPLTWGVTLAARTEFSGALLVERLRDRVLPALNASGVGGFSGGFQIAEDQQRGRFTLTGPLPFALSFAVRGGVLFGSNQVGQVDDWESGIFDADSFIDSAEFRRINAGRSSAVGALLYAEVDWLIPLLAGEVHNWQASLPVLPVLTDALQLDVIESVALLAGSSESPAPVRLAIGVREIKPGPWHLLASTPSNVNLARAFPRDTTLFLQSSMASASEIVDDLMAFAAAIDPVIADEYSEERGEFKRETGLDPQSDLLANFVDAWALGAYLESDAAHDVLFVVRLGSLKSFKTHLHTLRVFYQLETTTTHHRGVAIEGAARRVGPFFYAVVDGLLLLAPERQTIVSSIDAMRDGKGLDRTPGFERWQASLLGRTDLPGESSRPVKRRIGRPPGGWPATSKLLYFNLGDLLSRALASGDVESVPPVLEAAAKAGTGIGLVIVPHKRMIALELVSTDDSSAAISSFVVESITASLDRARYLSARIISLSNVQGVLTACLIYAHDHHKRWPATLNTLVEDGSVSARQLSSPYPPAEWSAGAGEEDGEPYYLYRHIADPKSVKDPGLEVVVSEREVHRGGAVFGFMDGHAEWIESPRADELLATMRSRE